jgi:phosphatidylcholine synthase
VASAWLVHLYTASGALFAFFSLNLVVQDRYREAFVWLALSVIVDSTDGMLARRVNVSSRLPWFNGDTLDNIVDYLTYVFVPAVIVWYAPLVPDRWGIVVPGAMLLSSLYGFSREDAKTADHFFTGFPSYWNIVVAYLYVFQLPQLTNAIILVALAMLVFVPIRYIYPSRTKTLQVPTLLLGASWAAIFTWMIVRLPSTDGPLPWLSLIFPAWYVALSLWLHGRD